MDSLASLSHLGHQNDCAAKSVVKALDDFLRAVQEMRDVVMVPHRLKDMHATVSKEHVKIVPRNGHTKALVSSSMSNSAPALTNGHNGDLIHLQNGKQQVSVDLYCFYSMLYAIRNELLCGSHLGNELSNGTTSENNKNDENDDGNGSRDEHVTELAATFRQHMQGLLKVLHQLTESADFLSRKYQDEIEGRK